MSIFENIYIIRILNVRTDKINDMRRNTLPPKFQDKIERFASEAVARGELKVDKTDNGYELQMDTQTSQDFSYLLQEYYLMLIASNSGIPNLTAYADHDIIYYIPLDEAYVPPTGSYSAIAQRWQLERYFDLLTMSATLSFLEKAIKSVAGTTLANIKVRPIIPAELGGYYNNNTVGPNISAITGTPYRTFGTVPIDLNAGVNTNVVDMQTNLNQLNNTVFVIHKIRDTTIPQNALGFAFTKNQKPYPPTDYSGNVPWISVPWSRNSYRYTVIGLLTPFMIAPNESFTANVYSIATASEQLFFEGFVAYIGPS